MQPSSFSTPSPALLLGHHWVRDPDDRSPPNEFPTDIDRVIVDYNRARDLMDFGAAENIERAMAARGVLLARRRGLNGMWRSDGKMFSRQLERAWTAKGAGAFVFPSSSSSSSSSCPSSSHSFSSSYSSSSSSSYSSAFTPPFVETSIAIGANSSIKAIDFSEETARSFKHDSDDKSR